MLRHSILESLRTRGLLLLLVLGIVSCSSKDSTNQGPGSSSVTATWTGALSSPDTKSVNIQFALAEANGQLTGQMFVQDEATGTFFPHDEITGTRTGSDASWRTSTNLQVKGTFDLNGGFAGTLEFPADYPLAIHVVDLTLHR